jgi:Transglycosylase SLT domain
VALAQAMASRRRPPHERYAPRLREAYRRHGVLPRHLAGLIEVESGWNRWAQSPAGARWLTQFMPATAESYGVKGSSPRSQILGAARYLKDLGYKRGDPGAIRLALASYNAGPGNPAAAGDYPEKVLAASRGYRGIGRGAGRGAPPAGGGGGGRLSVTQPSVSRELPEPGGEGLVGLLRAMRQSERAGAIPSQGVAPPRHSAGPALPSGYQAVESGPPPPERAPMSDLLASIAGLEGGGIGRSTVTPGRVSGRAGGGGGGQVSVRSGGRVLRYGPSGGVPGRLQGNPIDRPGVRTRPAVLEGALAVSAILGVPIQVGTGTQHSQMTSSGNVSAHWTGNALDLPMAGRRLTSAGRSALIAAGMNPREARRAKGGIYNVNGWQVIFNTDDHWDHLHIQVPRGYKAPAWAHGRRGRR